MVHPAIRRLGSVLLGLGLLQQIHPQIPKGAAGAGESSRQLQQDDGIAKIDLLHHPPKGIATSYGNYLITPQIVMTENLIKDTHIRLEVSKVLGVWHLTVLPFGSQATGKIEEEQHEVDSLPTEDLGKQLPYSSNRVGLDPDGLTMIVINQHEANIIFKKRFPLRVYWAHWYDLQWHVSRVAPGRLVILTIIASGAVGLRRAARILEQLGSMLATHLMPSSSWTWIFIQRGKTLLESTIMDNQEEDTINQFNSNVMLSKYLPKMSSKSETSRWEYCFKHDILDSFCAEHNPDPIPPLTAKNLPIQFQKVLKNVPIIIIAGMRHHYLYYSLTSILRSPGVEIGNIIIVLGDTSSDTTTLLDMLNIKYIHLPIPNINKNRSDFINTKLFLLYRSVYQLVRDRFPNSPSAIFIDEDVYVSRDFFYFMSQTLNLLQLDPSLYCINGYNQLPTSLSNRAYNVSRILRGEVQVQYGYAVSLNFIREALLLWPKDGTESADSLYDFWLFTNVRKNRECIFPEVSRTKHFGLGVNSDDMRTQELYYLTTPILNESALVSLSDASSMLLQNWQHELNHSIRHSERLFGNPCSDNFLPKPSNQSKSYVFYYYIGTNAENNIDFFPTAAIHNCLDLWPYSMSGIHDYVTTMSVSPRETLYLVGTPWSSYAPKDLNSTEQAWNVENLSMKEHKFTFNKLADKNEAMYPIIYTSIQDLIPLLFQ